MPADVGMAVWDVGVWLNLHVLPTSASFHLMMAFGVLGTRHFTIQDLPFEHRLTSEVLEGGSQQYKCCTQGLLKAGLHN